MFMLICGTPREASWIERYSQLKLVTIVYGVKPLGVVTPHLLLWLSTYDIVYHYNITPYKLHNFKTKDNKSIIDLIHSCVTYKTHQRGLVYNYLEFNEQVIYNY